MKSLSFPFRVEKLVQALVFFSKAGIRDLTKLKAAKLLYFADKEHLVKHGRPILGDDYFCLDKGPVPSASLNIMNDALDAKHSEGKPGPDLSLIERFLKVSKKIWEHYPRFVAIEDLDADVFSESEIRALEETVRNYGSKTAGELIDLTHKEKTWIVPDLDRRSGSNARIPYRLFFEDQPEDVKEVLKLTEAEQEDRDFIQSLAG
jgi:uncharacterized phage-associated protein